MIDFSRFKFRPHCMTRCLVGDCKYRENGACYCVCRLMDQISVYSDPSGHFERGSLFLPSPDRAREYYENLSEEKKKEHDQWVEVECPEILSRLLDRLKEHVVEGWPYGI